MNNLLYFIEKHKYGILIALLLHVGVFIYMQFKTYEERVVFDTWSFRGKNIEALDDIEISLDQIETIQEAELFPELFREISSGVASAEPDNREKSKDPNQFYSSYQGNAVDNVRSFEQSVIQQLQSKHTSTSQSTSNIDVNDGAQNPNNQDGNPKDGSAGTEVAYAGETMVKYSLTSRHPLNNNDWHVRNPGYTCGNVNGTVTVRIRVAQSGDVVFAKYAPELSQNTNACMIQQAEKYALMSRFNYAAAADKLQEGTITYQFVYRRK
jgi:hypothetical protein